jgi:hypothetical protein
MFATSKLRQSFFVYFLVAVMKKAGHRTTGGSFDGLAGLGLNLFTALKQD